MWKSLIVLINRMKSSVKTPASLRYMKARLRPFSRPSFWGALIIIAVFAVVIYQYWQNPELLNSTSSDPEATNKALKNPNSAQVSSEDLAVGADLDNVDFLLNELNSQTEIPLNSTSKKTSKKPASKNNQDTIYSQFREKQKAQLNNSLNNNNSNNNLVNPIIPNVSNFNSISPITNYQGNKNQGLSENIVPNSIGRLYLSNRNQTLNQVNGSTPVTADSNPNQTTYSQSNNLSNPINSENNSNQNSINTTQPIGSPQINYSASPTAINNNSAVANPLTTPYSTNNNVINYQLPVVNYSNIQANPSSNFPVQNQGSRQPNQTTTQNNSSLQPSALNQPQF